MRRAALSALAAAALAAAGGWALSAPSRLDLDALDGVVGDPARGERLFHLGGCASCHTAEAAAEGAEDVSEEGEGEADAPPLLSGGLRLETPFGVFVAPNISPDPEQGIGGWTPVQFADAMLRGVSPGGAHYYPSFPYASYARVGLQDIADLHAWLMTLPPSDRANEPHALGFPWSVRRGIGLWKRLHLDPAPVAALEGVSEAALRGRALVEGLGHCGECHTPRDATGGLDLDRWLHGAPNPAGEGRTPPLAGLDWSAGDIAYYLETGFTPEFDVVGGEMVAVVENLARLPAADREAIAAYLKALPPP